MVRTVTTRSLKIPRVAKEEKFFAYSVADARVLALVLTWRTERCGSGVKTRPKFEWKNHYTESKLLSEYRQFASDAKYAQLCQILARPSCIELLT